ARCIVPGGTEVSLGPEAHGIGLLRRPLGTLRAAELLGFVVVTSVNTARQGRRWPGTELVGALHPPRSGLRVLWKERGLCRHPDPGSGDRAIRIGSICRIGGSIGLDDRGDLFAERNALVLPRPVRNAAQGVCVGFIDLG